MLSENILIPLLYLVSPLNFSIIGYTIWMDKGRENLIENPQHLLIIFGYTSSFIITVTRNGRVMIFLAFFTCMMAGYGFNEVVKLIKKSD